MADVQRLAHRALSPWLQHVARRPMPRGVPKGAPELSEVPRGPWMAQPKTAEALGKLHGLNGEATFEERLSEPGTRMDEFLIQVFFDFLLFCCVVCSCFRCFKLHFFRSATSEIYRNVGFESLLVATQKKNRGKRGFEPLDLSLALCFYNPIPFFV